MGHKKRKKLLKAAMSPGEQGGTAPDGGETMSQDPFHPEPVADPRDGAAFIAQVTPAMMDGAAHRAAEMADGVARHTIPYDAPAHDRPAGSPEAVDDARPTAASETDDAAAQPPESAAAVGESLADAPRAAQAAVAPADDVATGAAGSGSPSSTDIFGQYNAKVFEMVRGNMASTTALFAALVQARSVPEAVALNADHVRRQVEALTTQGRELATLAQKLALDALQPLTRRDR